MRTIELDIRNIHTARALHVYLRYMLRLAPHYGCNLDALHDTIHEMARDEARHGKAFEGLLKRYFK